MAGLNYANKNPSCTFSNEDLAKGYFAAVGSSLFVAIALRKMTANLSKGATGSRLLLLNTLVASLASGAASYCNTTFMRQKEVDSGILVYANDSLDPESQIGVSKICAR